MNDYIPREAAIKAWSSYLYALDDGEPVYEDDMAAVLDYVPAADVKPVVRGSWTMPLEDKEEIYGYVCECSNCGEKVIGNSYRDSETPICSYHFCPYCAYL